MKLKFCLQIFCFFLPLLSFVEATANEHSPEVVVNNRILASVNGKNISVFDVMRKMDSYLDRAYSDQALSTSDRQQFYSQSWKQVLSQMIDNELMLAEAKKLEERYEQPITKDADVREEMHKRFGPNVMASLDEQNLTYDEAWDLVYTDLTVQRISGQFVYLQARNQIGPQDIKVAYQDHLVKNPPKEEWKYQVLSIRSKAENIGNVYAQKAHALIRNEPLSFEALAKTLTEGNEKNSEVKITVSDDYEVEGKDLSDSHKAILCNLSPGSYSEPTSQVSRFDKSIVHRIFYLKDHKTNAPPKFDTMVDDLHDQLVQKEVEQMFPVYLARLRKQFNFDDSLIESLPSDFQPFALR